MPRALVCSLIMAAALRGGAWLLAGPLAGQLVVKVAALSVLVAGGLALFLALALASGAVAPGELKRMLRRA
jgi:hypothetical protein